MSVQTRAGRVKVPEGTVVKTGPLASPVVLTGNRTTTYRFDILDTTGRKFGELDGVTGGSVDWDANAQVKGGGKISVSKANPIHEQQIRIATNFPVADMVDFETDTEGFVDNSEFNMAIGPPKSITRTTEKFYEGGAALDIEYAALSGGWTQQNVIRPFATKAGQDYTFVARVLNTSCDDAVAKISFLADVRLAQNADWQTVVVPFKANADTAYFGINNRRPLAGQHIYMDSVVLYEGTTAGYNGETFRYAPFSWMHARVRPVLLIDGLQEQPLGTFIPSAPVEYWDAGGGRQEIELLDRTSVISNDYVESSYTVKKDTNVVSAVRKLIASTGEHVGALTPSNETVSKDMVWGAGTNKLTIINELLDSADYFALWSDYNGQFRVQRYTKPSDRATVFEFLDDDKSIFLPDLSIDRDIYDVPNKVIMTAQGDGESEGWVSTATNTNPNSPYSFANRGRWITDVQLGIEATSKEALDSKATRRLSSLAAPQATISIEHAPIPGLKVNDVVRFRREPADVNTYYTVTKTGLDFNSTSLAKTVLSQVVDL